MDRDHSFSSFQENDIGDLKSAIDGSLKSNSTREKIEAFTEDEDITGVGVAVASAILVFMEPERFTVIDRYAWKTLRAFGYLNEPYTSLNIDDYLFYLGICRALTVEHDVELRDLDRALWMIGRDL